jgi:5-methylcytosine-specific restriction endonuclease McrA
MTNTAGLSHCQNCAKELDQSPKAGRRKRNCSKVCREQHRQNLKRKPLATRICEHCGKQYCSNKEQRFCGKECRLIVNRIESKARSKAKLRHGLAGGLKTTPCGWCQEPRTYEIGKSTVRAYHPKCTIEARRARYRIKTVKRQGLVNKPSRLAADEVVRVYGNNCAICNEPIDLTLQRTSKMGLTVDHWIPLSKGGSDDMSNLRPAHWICNRRKSDSLPKETNA